MTLLRLLAWLLYPVAIFFGFRVMEPRYVALCLVLALLLRRWGDARKLVADLSWIDRGVLVMLLIMAGVTALTNSETLLRLYPVAMCAGMLALFGMSLISPPSMVERFSRLVTPSLPAEGIIYTRHVTQVWCVFFVCNGAMAFYSAFYCSREFWALYNGFIAYLLMGALFSGEWVYRQYRISRTTS